MVLPTPSRSADGGVADDTLHGAAVAVAQVAADEVGNGMRQIHCLLFQTLSYSALTAVDGGADTYFGIFLHDCLVMVCFL